MPESMHVGLKPLTRLIIVLIVLSPLALAVPEWIDAEPEGVTDWEEAELVNITPLTPRSDSSSLTLDQRRPITGFALNIHHVGDLNLYLKSVDEIADLGANSLVVLTPMFQRYVDSNEIVLLPEKCPTEEQLISVLLRARERGLHTTLLPIVLIQNPGKKEWRGVIKPDDWDVWWEHYDELIDRSLRIVNGASVDMLVIGSELNSTEGMSDRWERIVKRVRREFPGQIAYSANWDRYDKIEFWPMLDAMCVSSYFELERDDPDAPEDVLVEAWAHERDRLVRFAHKWQKPLVLSEVGYPSVPWASAHPWNYITEPGAKADHEAQARCWRAFFRAWTQTFADPTSRAYGFFGYAWSPYYHGDDYDTGYGIRGKPALEIVRRGMSNIRRESGLPASPPELVSD